MTGPVRHLVTTLAASGGGPMPLVEVAGHYRHQGGDLARVKHHHDCKDDVEALEWLILQAAKTLKRYVDVTEQDGVTLVGLRDGVTADKVRYGRKKVHLNVDDHVLGDPFNPNSGELVSLRKNTGKESAADKELRDSMERFGWVEEFPAIQDERGVTLVGNRRMKVAEELGLEPVIIPVKLGRGDPADVKRFRLAYTSNAGRKDHTKEESRTAVLSPRQGLQLEPAGSGRSLVGQSADDKQRCQFRNKF